MRIFKKTQSHSRLYQKYRNYTMLPYSIFIDNITLCQKFLLPKGDIVECGVWKGGMIAALSEVIGNGRIYHLFDSFEGLPEVQEEKDGKWAKKWSEEKSIWYFDNCRAEEHYAIEAMKLANCRNYKIYKGWFKDTLGLFEGEIALLRLDADWYDSTYQCLETLYPKVLDGGLIIIDDYYTWEGCIRAVYDYFSFNKITDRIRCTSNDLCYIIKNEAFPFELEWKKLRK